MKLPFLKVKAVKPAEKLFDTEITTAKDIIAPASVRVAPEYLDMQGRLTRSFFVFSYPRYLTAAWLGPVINLDVPLDISMFIHPVNTNTILRKLQRRVTEVQSELMEKEEKGLVIF